MKNKIIDNKLMELIFGANVKIEDFGASLPKEGQLLYFLFKLMSGSSFKSFECIEYRRSKICSKEEAKLIFSNLIGRSGGGEREGLSVEVIINELLTSAEFNHNLLMGSFDTLEIVDISRCLKYSNTRQLADGLFRKFGKSENLEKLKLIEYYLNESNINPERGWQEASQFNSTLSKIYCEKLLGCKQNFEISFGILNVNDQRRHEAANIEFGNTIKIKMDAGLPYIYFSRLKTVVEIIERLYKNTEGKVSGSLLAYLGDEGGEQIGLTFSSAFNDALLVPGPYFVSSKGYFAERQGYADLGRSWDVREDKAYWRGTDTGVWRYSEVLNAPRVKVSLFGKSNPNLINSAITAVEERPGFEEKENIYNKFGIIGKREDQLEILKYRYQIDIDGNANSWNSFFLKLLSGSPVLKLDSEFNFRQWYYFRLKPWENFVPVAADCSDLVEKIEFLQSNPVLAESIGKMGRQLALSLDIDSQLDEAAAKILTYLVLKDKK